MKNVRNYVGLVQAVSQQSQQQQARRSEAPEQGPEECMGPYQDQELDDESEATDAAVAMDLTFDHSSTTPLNSSASSAAAELPSPSQFPFMQQHERAGITNPVAVILSEPDAEIASLHPSGPSGLKMEDEDHDLDLQPTSRPSSAFQPYRLLSEFHPLPSLFLPALSPSCQVSDPKHGPKS